MLTATEKLLFLILVGASLAYAKVSFGHMYRVIRRGAGEPPSAKDLSRRALNAAVTWFVEKSIWKSRRVTSLFHVMIAWGFVFYFLVNFGDVLQGLFPITFMGTGTVGNFYRMLADLSTMGVLVGVVYFLLRRFVFDSKVLTFRDNIVLLDKVRAGGLRRDSLIVGLFILFHVGFRLISESFAIAAVGGDPFQPFGTAVSRLWTGWSNAALAAGHHLSWWFALGLILVFIPYFPYTKHIHLIMAGVNFLTKPRRMSLGALEPIDFEDESIEEFGVAKVEDLPWTNLVDAYSCIMCNRCQDVCPAYLTGKELSPAALEVNKRYFLNDHLEELAAGDDSEFKLTDYAISESAVWACTACGACIDICPVGNEPMFDIMYVRRWQMLMENEFPAELQSAYRGMERSGNPWNLGASDRMVWAAGMDVPTVEENPEPDILWWVGCAPAYDPRARETARAFARILDAAGVDYAVLGELESCTGDATRRSGNEYLFYELAMANIETLNGVQPKRIVTTCPHCLHTLGKEYVQFGANFDVIHHSQLLSELMAERKIGMAPTTAKDTIAFHDPCYLARQNGIMEPPRSILGAMAPVVEMPRHGKQSFCCGAGGAQMWKEEEPGTEPVNRMRYVEAVATGANTVAVGCPFCLTMLTDASKQADDGVVVKDIAELVAERMS